MASKGREALKQKAVENGVATPREGRPAGVIYVPGATLCPFCQGSHGTRPALASVDEERERREDEAARGYGRVASKRRGFRWMKCGRCQKTFKAFVQEPLKAPAADAVGEKTGGL